MLGIGSPHVRRHVIPREPLLLALVLHLVYVGIERRQLLRTDQHLLLTGRRIHVIQLALLSLFVALHERKPGSIRTPLGRLRTAPRQPSRLKQGVDGQRLGGRSLCSQQFTRKSNRCDQTKAKGSRSVSIHETTSQECSKKALKANEAVYTALPLPAPTYRHTEGLFCVSGTLCSAVLSVVSVFLHRRKPRQIALPHVLKSKQTSRMLPDIENLLKLQDADKEI